MLDNQAYVKYPRHRKWFNKLWLSEKLNYECGPCGVSPKKSDFYIIRPIYNLIGMSLGARKIWIEKDDYKKTPAGYFWCEWFDGSQYSVTYEHDVCWKPISCWKGYRNIKNLTRFEKWEKVDYYPELPIFFNELSDVGRINVEFIDNNIIEVHLRTSPDPEYNEIIPIWKDSEKELDNYLKLGYSWINSFDDADGFLDNPRIGFAVKN